MQRFFIYTLVLFCISPVHSQNRQNRVDSLKQLLEVQPIPDTNRLNTLILLANTLYSIEGSQENNDEAIKVIKSASRMADSLHDTRAIMRVNMFLGTYYSQNGNFSKGIEHQLNALKLAEKLKNYDVQENVLNSIGSIYFSMNDNDNALKYYQDALAMAQKIKNEREIARMLSHIGIIYHRKEEYGKALEFYTLCLRTCEKTNNQRIKAHVLNSFGRLFYDMALKDEDPKSLNKAINYYNQSLAIKREQKDLRGTANTLGNIAMVYNTKGDYELSLKYYFEGLEIAEKTHYVDWLKEGYNAISDCYEHKGDYKNALIYFKKYKQILDTIQNANVKEEIVKLQAQYNTEKKDNEILLLNKENDLQNEKLSRQNTIIYFTIGGLIIFAFFTFFIYRTYRQKQRINLIMQQKQKEILDSIHYAKRIQESLLPTEKYIERKLKELNRH